jgi:Fe-S cluster assembly ATP-binding protein
MTALEIRNLHVAIAGEEILKGINLLVREGEIHALMGPNGSGKSTLAYALAGHPSYEVTAGQVIFDGLDLLEMEPTSARGPVCFWLSSIRWPCPA